MEWPARLPPEGGGGVSIYDTYSDTISGMSREMVEMDGRNCTECQNWENRDKIGIMEIV